MDWETGCENLEEVEQIREETIFPDLFALDETERFAPSMEIQAEEISEVFKEIPDLEYNRWKELSVDERVEAMQQLENKVSEISKRDSMEVWSQWLAPEVFGYFDGESLIISEKVLEDSSYNSYCETLNILFHEERHAYQDYNLYVERVEQSDELVNAWRINNNEIGYLGNAYDEFGLLLYLSQPVEVDARVFAESVLNKLDIEKI